MRCLSKKLFVQLIFSKVNFKAPWLCVFSVKCLNMDKFHVPLPYPKMLYPCVICNEECIHVHGTIQCSECEKWVHST